MQISSGFVLFLSFLYENVIVVDGIFVFLLRFREILLILLELKYTLNQLFNLVDRNIAAMLMPHVFNL